MLDVGFDELFAVAVKRLVLHLHHVAGHADDAFDEVLGGVLGELEDDDVAVLGVFQRHDHLVGEGDAGAALEHGVFSATVWPGGLVISQQLNRLVLVAVVEHGAIVGADHHQRVFREAEAVEGFHQLADAPVELHDAIAARAEAALAGEALVGSARDVDVVGGEAEEKRL